MKRYTDILDMFSTLNMRYKKTLEKFIHILPSLVGVTQDDFQSLYVDTLERFIAYYIKFHVISDRDDTALQRIFSAVIVALKRRQGYLLPRGADSETAFREQETWTFAVFSAALLLPIENTMRETVAKQLLSEKSLRWLARHATLFAAWQGYLQDNTHNNIFYEIISFTCEEGTSPQKINLDHSSIDQVRKIEQENVAQLTKINSMEVKVENENTQKNCNQQESANKKLKNSYYDLPKDTVIQEIDLAELSQNLTKLSSEEENQKEVCLTQSSKALPIFKAKHFWQWLKRAILSHEIEINQTTGCVHRVEAGLLICFPAVIDAFLLFKAKELDIDVKEIASVHHITLIKAIKQHEALVRNAKHSRIHTYYLREEDYQQVLSGVVIKPEALIGKEIILPINETLIQNNSASS